MSVEESFKDMIDWISKTEGIAIKKNQKGGQMISRRAGKRIWKKKKQV
jgi:hypothetical protein